MNIRDFDYSLPPHLIAQTPVEPRDSSRLLMLQRNNGQIEHSRFSDIGDFLKPGDLLVANNSRVFPARIHGRRLPGGGKVEVLLLRRDGGDVWEALVRPGKRLRAGTGLVFVPKDGRAPDALDAAPHAQVVGETPTGTRLIRFFTEEVIHSLGEIPLPPYIHHPLADPERYQTVYSNSDGSAAAPTAGLHFTPELMDQLRNNGVKFAFVTLHIGADTFLPVREDDPRQHTIHREYCEVGEEVAEEVNRARRDGRRVVAVGTTTVRALETAAAQGDGDDVIAPFQGCTDTYILPGHRFRAVDAMITNFHLPRSTLLMLVCAFAGRELALRAYREAIEQDYRFYSFGDAMLIL